MTEKKKHPPKRREEANKEKEKAKRVIEKHTKSYGGFNLNERTDGKTFRIESSLIPLLSENPVKCVIIELIPSTGAKLIIPNNEIAKVFEDCFPFEEGNKMSVEFKTLNRRDYENLDEFQGW